MGILDPARYAAVYARIHSRLGRLLPDEVWEDLLAVSDLPEFMNRLEGTAYQDAVRSMRGERNDGAREIEMLERAIRGHLARASRSPLPLMLGGPRDLLEWRWRRFEIDNLKTVLRAVEWDVDPQRARATLIPLGEASEVPWRSLVEAESVPAVVESIADTFYGEILSPALARYRREGLLFILEVRLDLGYFRRLLELIGGLHGRDRKEAERFLGIMIDSQNLLWAFRYRIFYHLSPEEILTYSLHRGVRVDAMTIRSIAEGARVRDVIREVWNGDLPGLQRLDGISDADALLEAEGIFNDYLFQEAQQTRKGYAMHLGIVLGYEVLLETEVHDLITIAEGRSANWSPREIRPYLIAKRG